MVGNYTILPVPLYHGTSDICLKLIKSRGLGGVNLSEKYQWKDFFSQALRLANRIKDVHGVDPFEEVGFGWVYERMVQQTSDGANFRYGGVYFSSDYYVAARYAETAPEFIDNAINMLKLLMDKDETIVNFDPILPKLPLYRLIIDENLQIRRPVLLKAANVPIQILLTERGERDISAVLEHLLKNAEKKNKMLEELEEFKLLSQMNIDPQDKKTYRLRELRMKFLTGELDEKKINNLNSHPYNFECLGTIPPSQLEFAINDGEQWSKFNKLDEWPG